MQIPIVTKEVFDGFDNEHIGFYLNGPVFDNMIQFAVYKVIRGALNENDTGDIGFPELVLDYLRTNHPEQLKRLWDGESDPDFDAIMQWLQEDEERDDELCVHVVRQVYETPFHYDGLIEFATQYPQAVICKSRDAWDALQEQAA